MKPSRLRPQAEADLIDAAQFYQAQGGAKLPTRFFDTALGSLDRVARMPGMGSLRLGQLCEIPGLRSWAVTGFAHRWFYFERRGYLDVVRLLGERQDIIVILAEGD